MPGAGFQKKAREWREAVYDTVTIPYEKVKAQMVCSFCFTEGRQLSEIQK